MISDFFELAIRYVTLLLDRSLVHFKEWTTQYSPLTHEHFMVLPVHKDLFQVELST